MTPYQYRKSHCGDKTVVRSSYLHSGISYTGKMTSLYWIRAKGPVFPDIYSKSHYRDKTAMRSSYFPNGNPYIGRKVSVYWHSPLMTTLASADMLSGLCTERVKNPEVSDISPSTVSTIVQLESTKIQGLCNLVWGLSLATMVKQPKPMPPWY